MKPTRQNIRVRNLKKARQRIADAALARPEPRASSRHRFSASTTEENQWESGEAPQVKTSRMFVAMVLLHLVAVGGLVAFHYFGNDGDAGKPPAGTKESKAGADAPKSTPPASTARARIVPDAPPAETNRPLPEGYVEHLVREDETAESIAAGRGITLAELRQANPGVDFFHVGRRIVLPPRRNVVSAVPDDTARRLAEKQQDSMHYPNNTRAGFNKYAPNPEAAKPQQALPSPLTRSEPAVPPRTKPPLPQPPRAKIVDSTPKGSAVKVVEKKAVKTSSSYIVRKGDTLYSISRDTGVSVSALQRMNGIASPDKLQPGKQLKLSASK